MNKKEKILDQYPENEFTFLPDEFDHAIVGVIESFGSELKICYDKDEVIGQYVHEGMSYDEAIEFFEYNTIGAYVGETTPVFMTIYFQS